MIEAKMRVVDFRMLAKPLSVNRLEEIRAELHQRFPNARLRAYEYALIVEVPEN